MLRAKGVVPTRANEIKAKKRKQQRRATDALRLDVDTRLSTAVDGPGVRKHDVSIISKIGLFSLEMRRPFGLSSFADRYRIRRISIVLWFVHDAKKTLQNRMFELTT